MPSISCFKRNKIKLLISIFPVMFNLGLLLHGTESRKTTYSCWRTKTNLKRFYYVYYSKPTKTAFPIYCDCTYSSTDPECTSTNRAQYFRLLDSIEPFNKEGAAKCCGKNRQPEESMQYPTGFPTLAMEQNRVCFVDNSYYEFSVYDGSNRHLCSCDPKETTSSCLKKSEIIKKCDSTCKKKFEQEFKFQRNHCCGSKQFYFDCEGASNKNLLQVYLRDIRDTLVPEMKHRCECPKRGSKISMSKCGISGSKAEEKSFKLSYEYDNFNCCDKRR